MSLPDFKTQIKNIRKEAIELGFAISTIDDYEKIWNNFIKWKKEESFIYDENDYSKFLLEYYDFDVKNYSSKSKSRHQQYMRSKRILDDFDNYKKFMLKRMFPNKSFNKYPSDWNIVIYEYLNYCRNIKFNCENSIKLKQRYLERELSYFYQNGIDKLSEFSNQHINQYIIDTINAGNTSKRRNFYVLKDFLQYLFIENIINEDLSVCVPKTKQQRRKKLPTYLKQEQVEELLSIIPKEKSIDKRNYAIILLAARLGLRISDILNIKLKDIDWENNKINVVQPKTNNLNVLPLSKEVGWTIIDYIKVRPKCNSEYLFIKFNYPFEKLTQFSKFNKYFNKIDAQTDENNKKGIHNLRHSIAKNMLDNDIPIEIISSTLGHSSCDITSNTYIKIDIKNLKKCTLEVD